jgi:hypothetical protein
MGLTEDRENNIWVVTHATPSALIRIEDLKVREEFPAPPMPVARKLAPDPQNGIWMLCGGRRRPRTIAPNAGLGQQPSPSHAMHQASLVFRV